MTDSKIATTTAASLVDQLRDKIKLDVAQLMPKETWDALLESEIKKFIEPPERKTSHYGSTYVEGPSDLGRVVNACLKKLTEDRLKTMLMGKEWQGYWDGQRQETGEKIKEMVRENGTRILSGFVEDAIQNVISRMSSNV